MYRYLENADLGTRQDLVHAPNDGIKLRLC